MKSKLKLKKFRVTNFRSVEDSGWIDCSDVVSLIGINESGKSNLLLPLWKFNPAKDGAINPLADYPRNKFNEFRSADKKPTFIEAEFELTEEFAAEIASLGKVSPSEVRTVNISRKFDGEYFFDFTSLPSERTLPAVEARKILSSGKGEIAKLAATNEADEALKSAFQQAVKSAEELLKGQEALNSDKFETVNALFSALDTDSAPDTSLVGPKIIQIKEQMEEMLEAVSLPITEHIPEVEKKLKANLPKFVYYSNYGNLDSEIYLPHVIENLNRKDLGPKEEAKARTLKVLFDFVNLKPKEILDLGQEGNPGNADQIKLTADKKREREILLQSASSKLTEEFKAWWRQGDYKFRFNADGNHFRIWVSDEKRPEEIELEGRSTGLQWFLSFFLVFLVESKDAHAGAVLLLDEPGLTLHPLAQKDLSKFFDGLASHNQIIFSTHSPFLIDADKLDRVKAVFTDTRGKTVVTADLRASAPKSTQAKSIFAAHAALGLSVSDVMLQGCQPVVVEGPSDQHYLSAIKTFLIGAGKANPQREILFIPAGGTKGVKAVAPILAGKQDELPFVIIDSDQAGVQLAASLRTDLYAAQKGKVLQAGLFTKCEEAEIEDLMPQSLIAQAFSRLFRADDADFADEVQEGKPIVPQMEAFAKRNGMALPNGWKVDLAAEVKRRLLSSASAEPAENIIQLWVEIFARLMTQPEKDTTTGAPVPGKKSGDVGGKNHPVIQ